MILLLPNSLRGKLCAQSSNSLKYRLRWNRTYSLGTDHAGLDL